MSDEIIKLNDIIIVRNEKNKENIDTEVGSQNLSLSVSSWMKSYKKLRKPELRAQMRDVCIDIAIKLRKGKVVVKKHGTFASKFKLASPYFFFLSIISEIEDTHNKYYTVSFHEIIDYSLGEIVNSIHFCQNVEVTWIVSEYMLAAQNPKMTILCEKCLDENIRLDIPFDVDIIPVISTYRHHHAKFSILKYSDNTIRIIILTGDLENTSWQFYCQGFWISPKLPCLPDDANPNDGESITNFKSDLIDYLLAYNNFEILRWGDLVQKADFSAVNVFFIGSVPGIHKGEDKNKWGQEKVKKVLSNHVTIDKDSRNWPVVVQSFPLGYCGSNYEEWLLKNALLPMSMRKNKINYIPKIKFICPTMDNYNQSVLPKSIRKHFATPKAYKMSQEWMKDYLYKWKSKKACIDLSMPNIKTYTRISPDNTEISWFFLSSGNLTIGGWGINDCGCLKLQHYEVGVMFIPEIIIKQTTFPVKKSNSLKKPVFLLPYDLPLTKYRIDDEPIIRDQLQLLRMFLNKNKNSSKDSTSSNLRFTQNLRPQRFNRISCLRKSFIDSIILSIDRVTREKIRDNAILKMKEAGHKIFFRRPGEFARKYALSAPYHFFLNRVEKSNITHNQEFSVSFTELLDISLGEIVDSLHINFMVEIKWLCLQYLLAAQNPKMTIFCDSVCDPQTSIPNNINLVKFDMPSVYGCHHSKVSVFKYKDNGIRIIVSTANIYTDDWENRTQGIWISPHLRKLPDTAKSSDGDSPTNFKKYFREYLTAYKHPQMRRWKYLIKRADFSSINVFFFASIPGDHKGFRLNSYGQRRLGTILSEHAVLPPDAPEWKLLAQCAKIGSLGPNYESWILTNIVESMSKEKNGVVKIKPDFQLIYPSWRNFEESYDCQSGSCCLQYSKKHHEKQQWLTNYLCQWKADVNNRTKAMPQIKSYTRISPDQTQIPWFVLTSANLNKGAWGFFSKSGTSHYIDNYEAGVVFIPKFIINETVFPIKTSSSPDIPIFRLPYDLPLTKYQSSDFACVKDYLNDE